MPDPAPIRLDPFQRIVDVSWASIRYFVVAIADNSSEAPVTGDTWIAEDTDAAGLVASHRFSIPSLIEVFNTPLGPYDAWTKSDHRVAASALITAAGRRDAIDHARDYYFSWYVVRRTSIIDNHILSGTFANVFCLGRYALDNPGINTFRISMPDLSFDVTFTRPLTPDVLGHGGLNWGIPQDDMDRLMDPQHF